MNLKKFVRSIPNYPKKGILFRDITSLIENARAFNYALKKMYSIILILQIARFLLHYGRTLVFF